MEWRVNILRSRRFGSHRKHGVDMECFIFGRVQGIQASPAQAGNLSASFCGEYPAGWDLDVEVDNNSAELLSTSTSRSHPAGYSPQKEADRFPAWAGLACIPCTRPKIKHSISTPCFRCEPKRRDRRIFTRHSISLTR